MAPHTPMFRLTIRGNPHAQIRHRFSIFCRHNGRASRHPYLLLSDGKSIRPSQLFRNYKQWHRIIGSLSDGWPCLLWINVPSASIRIKHNAHVFFPGPGASGKHPHFRISGKIALPSKNRKGSLAREIIARRFAKAHFPGINIPKILMYDRRNPVWFEEEYICSGEFDDRDAATTFLSGCALDLYKPCARPRPLAWFANKARVHLQEVLGTFVEIGMPLDEKYLGGTLPVAFLHGDLAPSNMILDPQNRLFLLDWEKACVGPIAWDLRKVFKHDPGAALGVLRSCGPGCTIPPLTQIQLMLAAEIVLMRREWTERIEYHREQLGHSRDQAKKMLQDQEKKRLNQLRDLCFSSGDME